MNYEIFGGSYPAVTIRLDRGDSVFTQSGAMSWMTEYFTMSTNMDGGFLKGLGRLLTGESLMFVYYTAERDQQEITFSAALPGEIKKITLDANHDYIAQKNAFLCGTRGVELDTKTTDRLSVGLFGGEGIFMQHIHGEGEAFVEFDGTIREMDLAPGETIKVDTSNIAMFESRVHYDIETVKGLKNILFGGEGLFLATLTGPGKVWLQTMTARDLASRLIPYLPAPSSSSSSHD